MAILVRLLRMDSEANAAEVRGCDDLEVSLRCLGSGIGYFESSFFVVLDRRGVPLTFFTCSVELAVEDRCSRPDNSSASCAAVC